MIEATFHGGPADGCTLKPSRAPLFLRVVVDRGGVLDCLCALEDEPTSDERVHVYRAAGAPSHICNRRGVGHSGCYTHAVYEFMDDVDADELGLRDSATWQAWAESAPRHS